MTASTAKWPVVALAGWLAVIGAVTLVPTGDRGRALSLCLACGESGGSGFLLNILLFVPFGALLVRLGASPMRATLLGLGASTIIEVAQFLLVPGRVTSLGDLLANCSGALVGALLWEHRAALIAPRGGRFAAAYAAAVIGVLWFGHWSSQPWLPDGRWFLQRTPLRAWSDPHSGALPAVSVNATNLPSDRIRDAALVARLRSGQSTLDLTEVPGVATARLAYTARLVHANERTELFAIGRSGESLVLHRLTNAARLRLSAPGVRIPDVYTNLRDRTVEWRVDVLRGRVRLQAEAGARAFMLPDESVLRGWAALLPRARDFTPLQLRVLDLVWGVVLCAPLFGWSLRRREIGGNSNGN